MDFPSIERKRLSNLQVNLGYKCNQACSHCHVDASPLRKEMMNEYNISLIPKVIKRYGIDRLDLTGGAPEMHPLFKDLIFEVNKLNIDIIDRCNLTILSEPGYEYLAEYLARNKVIIIASLPCYEEINVDFQRGKGVFKRSIKVLKELNQLGYGKENSGLQLDLVYNPIGAVLPPSQTSLEMKYKEELSKRFDIEFNNLLVLANMPIKRFALYLDSQGKLEEYKSLLAKNHNSNNLDYVMCKDTLSIDWQGKIYDCDFNQQLGLNAKFHPFTLNDLANRDITIKGKQISVGEHCFGCTAGNGSSCGGSLS